jgi:probable F420-dependent oxidoreductase
VSAIIPPGTVAWGLQLPVQAQSTLFVEPWEATATADDLVAVAQAADRAGALYVGVCEHVAIPEPHDRTMGTTWYHPFTTLGFLAGVTSSVRLLSHVIALPYHHPLEVAKAFTTLDALSGGRAIVGVGAGHVEAEFALLGADFAGRGRWVERALPAIRAALDDEYPALPGGDWGLDGSAAVSPRPVQASVPIWVGGSSRVAVRRAAQQGDGWLPQGVRRGDLPGVVARVRDLRAAAGRPERFDVGALVGCYVGTPSWDVGRTYVGEADRVAEQLRTWVEAGANQLQVRFRSRDRGELVDQIGRFGAEVAPLLAG